MMHWTRKHRSDGPSLAREAIVRADRSMILAQSVSDEVHKVTASMNERIERNHLTESIDAIFVTRREGRQA